MAEEKEEIKVSVKKKLAKKDEEIEKAHADMEHWKNEYYRVYADMANLRKDIEKDHREVVKYRIEGFVDKLIGILDAFDMAFKIEPKTDEMKNYLQGFKYVYSSLINVLEEEGIQVINPQLDADFDENTMHAVETIECDCEPNKVKEVTLKGYKLHDHLVRPAMVIVSKKKEEPVETNDQEEKNIA
ncbi:MAG: nucleotide exchange factor GrpE [Candidatus Onthovivens sp.]|nr:nucleotide exchange factor GrpE [Mollicutes bacterium]MDY4857437.1 nucleotide exchange factor GrpE [Candidatus Onthovivens sp.]